MTYNVFAGTLNPTLKRPLNSLQLIVRKQTTGCLNEMKIGSGTKRMLASKTEDKKKTLRLAFRKCLKTMAIYMKDHLPVNNVVLRDLLSDRTFPVVYGGNTSATGTVCIICSVPQGSVLGPSLFIVYTTDLENVVIEYGVNLQAFADDSQLYLHCHRDDTFIHSLKL